MRILIAGYYTAPIHALEYLFASGYKPSDVALLTYDDARNQPLLHFARWHGVEVQTFSCKSDECYQWIQARGFDVLLSLYYRHIIPARVLDLFQGRAANLHAGLLPKYAGCWSSAWSIINGENDAGFTWHYMTPDVDAGNTLKRIAFPILHRDTAYSLYHRVLLSGIEALNEILHDLNVGYAGRAQHGERGYYSRAIPFGGYIQPEWDTPMIERFIRAMYFPPFKGALLRLPDGSEREILSMQEYKEAVG